MTGYCSRHLLWIGVAIVFSLSAGESTSTASSRKPAAAQSLQLKRLSTSCEQAMTNAAQSQAQLLRHQVLAEHSQ